MKVAVPVRVDKQGQIFPCYVDGSELTTFDEYVAIAEKIEYLGEIGKDIVLKESRFNPANFKLLYRVIYEETIFHILACENVHLEDIRHAIFVRLVKPTNNILALSTNPPKEDDRFLTYDSERVLFYFSGKPFIRHRKTEKAYGER